MLKSELEIYVDWSSLGLGGSVQGVMAVMAAVN